MLDNVTPGLQVSIGQCCDGGRKERNDDCIGVHVPDCESLLMKGVAAVIADGVSAATYGKEAAEMCVQSFLLDYYSTPDSWSVKKSGEKVINSLNRWLYGQSHTRGANAEKGYVSTLSSLVIVGQTATIFHIGDTRIYRVRDGVVELITRDHHASISRDVRYLGRAMGLNLSAKVDFHEVSVKAEDMFLFTTDGVHEWIDEQKIASLVSKVKDLDLVAKDLVECALASGSPDNATALIVKVDSLPKASHEELQKFIVERPFPPLLYPGQTIDGLEVESVLYESSRSQLYKVKDRESGAVYAMKTPSLNFSDDPAYIERFVTEEWIGKRVSHQNLIRAIERDTKPRFLYYLMEEIEGESLAALAKRHKEPLPPSDVVPLIKQVVDGVRALHRKDTLHQDLKPDNLILGNDGVVKVIDFGSCRVASIQSREVAHDRQEALGTLDYSAPEYRIDGAQIGAASDQFSIAMIAYRLLTKGKCPYGDKWQKAQSQSDFMQLSYTPAFKYSPLVPYWLDRTLEKALSIRSSSRYESLSELVRDLEVPNKKFVDNRQLMLMERDPLLFWKCLSAALFVVVAVLLYLLSR